jgi:DNA helicase-2/ATP-dependent DNA helicase PcrA
MDSHASDSGYGRQPWHHPQAAAPTRSRAPDVAPGERYVDREFFEDSGGDDGGLALQRGSRVVHAQFGEGEVRSVVHANEPAVVVAFPGRGEKKILARFLKLP